MKFLLINGKLYKRNSDNKFIAVPDNYNNTPLRLNNQLVKTNTAIVGSNQGNAAPIPGLYDENDNLIKTWDELVAEGLVTIE